LCRAFKTAETVWALPQESFSFTQNLRRAFETAETVWALPQESFSFTQNLRRAFETAEPSERYLKSTSHSHRALARCKKAMLPENCFNGFPAHSTETVKTVS
jgi:hypothetical protein